jgi:hypothetical protein
MIAATPAHCRGRHGWIWRNTCGMFKKLNPNNRLKGFLMLLFPRATAQCPGSPPPGWQGFSQGNRVIQFSAPDVDY